MEDLVMNNNQGWQI